jgi:hypothetical protein
MLKFNEQSRNQRTMVRRNGRVLLLSRKGVVCEDMRFFRKY